MQSDGLKNMTSKQLCTWESLGSVTVEETILYTLKCKGGATTDQYSSTAVNHSHNSTWVTVNAQVVGFQYIDNLAMYTFYSGSKLF